MRLGGIDPSILRELSGVYKPFVKAFKELISNSFDADAQRVEVTFAPDFSSVTAADDGAGMTPFDFRTDFTRIGGGSRRWSGDRTRRGRLRIGSKGIGFLALARYCNQLTVESSADRVFSYTTVVEDIGRSIDIIELLGVPLSPSVLAKRLRVSIRQLRPKIIQLNVGKHYKFDAKSARIIFHEKPGAVEVSLRINCKRLVFTATLDFDRLLKLADAADLEHLDDFASIDITEKVTASPGTRITAAQLKPFVRRELRLDRRKGYVRNIGSWSGLEQFVWQLSRCTPVPYVAPPTTCTIPDLMSVLPVEATLPTLTVRHATTEFNVYRPIFPFEPKSPPLHLDMHVPVRIDEGGLVARGFLAGYESIVFPAEYRGISIRVRGVAIGEPGFLGAEHLLTGANKAALSQITGEIVIVSGLDAVDTLNPGRESFYEESEQYKTLRRHILGEGEQVRGCLGQAIAAVLRRSQVRSALSDVLGRATIRRRALEDISAAITHLLGRRDETATAILQLLKSKASHVNGLVSANDHELGTPLRIGGLTVVCGKHLPESAVVDFSSAQVRVDIARPEWSWRLLLHNRSFDIIHKHGKPIDPIAEIDLKTESIYVNWGHPIKQQMDERSFLRFALAWLLAKESACENPVEMMDLALRLMSFTSESNA